MKQILLSLLRMFIVLGVLAAVVQILRPKLGPMMEKKFEEMPDDFPPKWMFNNITAIREQNEQIIELLGGEVKEPERVKESA